jgi:hypothetical protein
MNYVLYTVRVSYHSLSFYKHLIKTKQFNLNNMKDTKNFTPCAMPCTEEQWNKQLKPVLELIEGVEIMDILDFDKYPYVVNNLNSNSFRFSIVDFHSIHWYNRTVLAEFNICKFLQLSGIDVVIQGNKANADKIKQWWKDRGWNHSNVCTYNNMVYGIVDGIFCWRHKYDLPEGTHIINPFGNEDKVEVKETPPAKTFPRYMYGSDEPMDADNKGLLKYAVGVIGGKIWFVSNENAYNIVQDGITACTFTFKYTREVDEPLSKPEYSIEQLIEMAGLNKDEIKIVD